MAPKTNRKAIIAIMKGGLGNQLFIYAAARAMALRMGRDLYLDTMRGYCADTYQRSYRLDRFPIVARTMPEHWKIAPSLQHPKHKITRAINKFLPKYLQSYIAERTNTAPVYLARSNSLRKRITMLGYWQNESYFVDMAEKIRTELTVPSPENIALLQRGNELMGRNTVFVHVRRKRYSPLLGLDYYQAAIDRARREIQEPVFILFGDEPSWAKDQLDFGPCDTEAQPYQENDELTDLWLMTKCQHAIVANSTFSWWGAWLGGPTNDSRRVWAPYPTGLTLANTPSWSPIPTSLTYTDKK